MKKYEVEISETAEQDLENIISYLRFSLAGDIIADKYKILFIFKTITAMSDRCCIISYFIFQGGTT